MGGLPQPLHTAFFIGLFKQRMNKKHTSNNPKTPHNTYKFNNGRRSYQQCLVLGRQKNPSNQEHIAYPKTPSRRNEQTLSEYLMHVHTIEIGTAIEPPSNLHG
jgi:hypothetical protein